MEKKFGFYLIFALIMSGTFVCSCSEEKDFGQENTAEMKLQQLKMRVLRIAAEYGFDDYQVDENLLRKNLDITDEKIEQEMRMFAYIPGTYKLESDGNGKLIIKCKISKTRRTRGWDDFGWPENETGSFDGRDSKAEDYSVNGSFNYGYGQSGNDYMNAEFSISCWETTKDKNGNEVSAWSDPYTATIISGNNIPANGEIDSASLNGSYVVVVESSTGYRYFEITYSGTNGNPNCTMNANEISSTDPRVSSWDANHKK